MYRNVIDVTTARKNLSSVLDEVFLEGKEYVITKRNIPLVKVTRVENFTSAQEGRGKKGVDLEAFGMLSDDTRDRDEIARDWRKKAWTRNDS